MNRAIVIAFVTSIAFISLLVNGCRKPPANQESSNTPTQTSTGFGGKYIAGIKRGPKDIELFKLEVTRQGDEITGLLYFLASAWDSIDAYDADPQKADLQVFENFPGRPPDKISGKATGDSIEFASVEPLSIGNYIYQWHFKGQIQGDKLVGQLEEKLKDDDQAEPSESSQSMPATFNKVENK